MQAAEVEAARGEGEASVSARRNADTRLPPPHAFTLCVVVPHILSAQKVVAALQRNALRPQHPQRGRGLGARDVVGVALRRNAATC